MFIIVRHGNTFEAGEPPRRIGARTDLTLTAAGLAQGHALGARFGAQGWRFARVLVSLLTRTREMACAILSHQPPDTIVTPEPCDWLREIDPGADEDRYEGAVLARNGAACFALRAAGLAVTGGSKAPAISYGTILRGSDGALDVAEWGRRP